MKWKKLGRIIAPQPELFWNKSHAMMPTPLHLGGNFYRIYFSGRDENNVSHIGWVLLDITEPHRILETSLTPVLSPGQLGCFDDNGVTPSSIIKINGKVYMYYVGWKPRCTTRFGVVAGLAVSEDDGLSFRRVSRAPLLHRTNKEPFGVMTAPSVIEDDGIFKMWYVSGTAWANPDLPYYNIKYAESDNGFTWRQDGVVAIESKDDNESALGRPCVMKDGDVYRMWYSYKDAGKAYTLGYADSSDGLSWTRRDDKVGISPSSAGWDSEMIEYGYIFSHKGAHYMLYNGNDYGRSGAGLAVMQPSGSEHD